jgi:hypothetical protein
MPDAEMKDAEKEEEIVGKKGLSEIGGSKTKEDFTPLLESSIPQNRDLALKQGKKAEAIENLLGVSPRPLLAHSRASPRVSHDFVGSCARRFVFSCSVGHPHPTRGFLAAGRCGAGRGRVGQAKRDAALSSWHCPSWLDAEWHRPSNLG